MKTYNTSNVRNVVLLGSSKSGKTTFAETMMFEGKVIERRGTIEGKNTMSDNTEIEQIYQRSIYSTLLYTEFLDTKFNTSVSPLLNKVADAFLIDIEVLETLVVIYCHSPFSLLYLYRFSFMRAVLLQNCLIFYQNLHFSATTSYFIFKNYVIMYKILFFTQKIDHTFFKASHLFTIISVMRSMSACSSITQK